MKTRQFINLKETILGVQGHAPRQPNVQINESVEQPQAEFVAEENVQLVAHITETICEAESRMGTKFTPQEINEVTHFMVGKLQTEQLIESIQEAVGFELTEQEVEYVLNTLNEA